MGSLREALFPRLWRATSPDGESKYEVTIRGADHINVVPGLALHLVSYQTPTYWRWWLTHGAFSVLDVVAILVIFRLLLQIS